MMIRALLVVFGLLCSAIAPASAQGCGPTNPNCVVITAPNGDSSTKAASTKFVQNAFAGGSTLSPSSIALASGQIVIGQVSGFGAAEPVSGDLALSNAGVFTFNTVNANVGSFGSVTSCVAVTTNGKGLITAVSAATCTPAIASVTGLGAGVATFLGTPSGANLAAALTSALPVTKGGTGQATAPVTSVTAGAGLNGGAITSVGTVSLRPITSQYLISGSNLTYTTPANVSYIELFIRGGGSGGLGSGTTPGTGNGGNPTCWNTSGTACTSPVYQAGGAGVATVAATGGAGGTVSGSGSCNQSFTGNVGQGADGATTNSYGGRGAGAGGGQGGAGANAGQAAQVNSGGGGGGGGINATGPSGSGGGEGAYCYAVISAPAGTYVYTIGTNSGGGTAGTGGSAGGPGAAGNILVVEH